MSATTVRVDDAVKKELDKFQGLVQAETGQRITQSDLLERLLRFARANEAKFLSDSEKAWRPPTKDELQRLFSKVKDWGVKTDVTEIDEILYGGSPHE